MRETGFYWVLVEGKRGNNWVVAYWGKWIDKTEHSEATYRWWLPLREEPETDGFMEQINETRIKNPEEK